MHQVLALHPDSIALRPPPARPRPSMVRAKPVNSPAFCLDSGPSWPIMPLLPLEGALAPLNSTRNQGDPRMPRKWTSIAALATAGIIIATASARAGDPTASLKQGNPQLKSAGPLGFGPDGILFVGDTQGSAVFAIDTADRAPAARKSPVQVNDLAAKAAAMLGTKPQQIMINDLAVNPISGNVYLSVSRAAGPIPCPCSCGWAPMASSTRSSLENVRFARAEIPNPPDPNAKQRGESLRNESITDLAYVDGRVFLAGLSNEEFSSRLIAIPFPFSEGFDGAAIEIYHGAHGRFETKSPVRTFVPYRIGNDPYLLAAYTCTPLVKVPVSELKAGATSRERPSPSWATATVPST